LDNEYGINKKSHHLLALVCLFAFFLQAEAVARVWFLSFVEGERLKTSPRFSSSLVFSQAKKECKGLVWANRLLPGGGVIFLLPSSTPAKIWHFSLSCYAESQGDERDLGCW
jgi:hypothetical protein